MTMINKHRTTRVPGKPRDFVDCYLDELDTVCVCVGIKEEAFCLSHIHYSTVNLFSSHIPTCYKMLEIP